MNFGYNQRISAWSFSRFNVYDTCPQQAKFKFIDRLKEPSSPAMDRGSEIHKKGEDFVAGKLKNFPEEYQHFEKELKLLKEFNAPVEQQWAFDITWKPVDWFAKEVYCRIKVDAYHVEVDTKTLYIIDHKTGRKRPGNELQMDLYAVGGFSLFKNDLKFVQTELWYLDEGGDPVISVYEEDKYLELRKEWDGRVRAMRADTTFKPKPGNHCRFCHFRKSNGGPCVF